MARVFTRLSVRIIVSVCLLLGTIRLIGAFIPVPGGETLAQFGCSPQPCWHDLHLGVTTVSEAVGILSADKMIGLVDYLPTDTYVCWKWQNEWRGEHPIWDGCYGNIPNSHSTLILNYANNLLRLGDAMHLLGRPSASLLCTIAGKSGTGLLYSPRIRIAVNVPDDFNRIDPEYTVTQIVYSLPEDVNLAQLALRSGWSGYSTWANTSPYCGG